MGEFDIFQICLKFVNGLPVSDSRCSLLTFRASPVMHVGSVCSINMPADGAFSLIGILEIISARNTAISAAPVAVGDSGIQFLQTRHHLFALPLVIRLHCLHLFQKLSLGEVPLLDQQLVHRGDLDGVRQKEFFELATCTHPSSPGIQPPMPDHQAGKLISDQVEYVTMRVADGKS